MTTGDIAVLLIGESPTENYEKELKAAGFGRILKQNRGESARSALARAVAAGSLGIVTVDEKQGWTISDVVGIADRLIKDDTALYVGEPKEKAKPNWIEKLYEFLSGVTAASAQTTLYGMSRATAEKMVSMKSNEDTFIMNIPLEARADSITIDEVQEADVIASEATTKLLTSSFKLYYVFLKFSIAAMIAYAVDIGTFGLFELVFASLSDEFKILWSTILSRVLCSVATYILNRGAVFHSQAAQGGAMVRFVILSVAQLIVSWLAVWWIGSLLGGSDLVNMLLKVIVDLVIFLASFTIMRDWVFKESGRREIV